MKCYRILKIGVLYVLDYVKIYICFVIGFFTYCIIEALRQLLIFLSPPKHFIVNHDEMIFCMVLIT